MVTGFERRSAGTESLHDRHQVWLRNAGLDRRRRVERARYRLRSLLARQEAELAAALPDSFFDLSLRDQHAAALESFHSNASAGPARQCPQA